MRSYISRISNIGMFDYFNKLKCFCNKYSMRVWTSIISPKSSNVTLQNDVFMYSMSSLKAFVYWNWLCFIILLWYHDKNMEYSSILYWEDSMVVTIFRLYWSPIEKELSIKYMVENTQIKGKTPDFIYKYI